MLLTFWLDDLRLIDCPSFFFIFFFYMPPVWNEIPKAILQGAEKIDCRNKMLYNWFFFLIECFSVCWNDDSCLVFVSDTWRFLLTPTFCSLLQEVFFFCSAWKFILVLWACCSFDLGWHWRYFRTKTWNIWFYITKRVIFITKQLLTQTQLSPH